MKIFTTRNLLIGSTALIVVLVVVLILVLIQRANEPTTKSSTIKVISESTRFIVPKNITAGKQFDYRVVGEKYVSNGADVRLQLNCKNNRTESIITIGTFYSNVAKGRFNLYRNTALPINARTISSDSCYLQQVATYVFYQLDKRGDERTITIPVVIKSNTFKFIVPENAPQTSAKAPQVSFNPTPSSTFIPPTPTTGTTNTTDRSVTNNSTTNNSTDSSTSTTNNPPAQQPGLVDSILGILGA